MGSMTNVDFDKMVRLYNQNLSLKEVAKQTSVSITTVRKWLALMGVKIRAQSGDQTGSKNPAWKGGTSRAHIGRITKKVCLENNVPLNQCQNCGKVSTQNLDRHHVDGNRMNNDISNIKVLCTTCHSSGWFGAEHTRDRDGLGRFSCS